MDGMEKTIKRTQTTVFRCDWRCVGQRNRGCWLNDYRKPDLTFMIVIVVVYKMDWPHRSTFQYLSVLSHQPSHQRATHSNLLIVLPAHLLAERECVVVCSMNRSHSESFDLCCSSQRYNKEPTLLRWLMCVNDRLQNQNFWRKRTSN